MKRWELQFLKNTLRSTDNIGKGRRRAAVALVCFIIITAGVVCLRPRFTIYNKTQDTVVYRVGLTGIEEICYIYRQSYDRGIIEEVFVPDKRRMVPIGMTYDTDSYDYHGSRYPDSERKMVNGRWHVVIRNHGGYPRILYRVGYTIEQEIRIVTTRGERTFLFSELGNPGDLIIVDANMR